MTPEYDQDFHPPFEKALATPQAGDRPNSKLAVVSLVFGILAWPVLPILGAIISIVTGHFALGQIREEEGRLGGKALAKAGMTLGSIQMAFVAVAMLLAFTIFSVRQRVERAPAPQVVATSPIVPSRGPTVFEAGVKMVNEMDRGDYSLIEGHKLNDPDEPIIACYNAGKPPGDPELALLTTRRLVYLKDGRVTSFPLGEIASLKDDLKTRSSYEGPGVGLNDFQHYYIEAQSAQGPRMRIRIAPRPQGRPFFDALESAWKAAGSGTKTNEASDPGRGPRT